MKIRIATLILLLTIITAANAAKKDKDAQPNPIDPNVIEAKLSAGSTEKKPDSVAISIGKYEITEKTIDEKLKPALEKMTSKVPPQFVEQYKSQLRKNIIERLVIEHLFTTEAKKAKVTVSDKEVDEEIDKQLASQKLTMDDFKELLKAYGTSYEEQKEQIKNKLLFTKLIDKLLVGKEKVTTEEEARKFYDENIESFKTPAQTRTSHILISSKSSDPNSDPNQVKAEALAKAQGLLKQVKEGADFAKLAKENSTCPSAKEGGDLGFSPKGKLVPEYENAAAALEPGQISDVVETPFGYHIIKLTGKQDANTVSFDEAKADILLNLTDRQKGEFVQGYVIDMLTNSKIVYTNSEDKIRIPEKAPAAEAEPAEAKPTTEAKPTEVKPIHQEHPGEHPGKK